MMGDDGATGVEERPVESDSDAASSRESPGREIAPPGGVTDLHVKAWRLRYGGKTPRSYTAVGRELGLGKLQVRKLIEQVGLALAGGGGDPFRQSDFLRKPEEVGSFIDELADPDLKSVARAARSAGLPDGAARGLVKKLESRFAPVVEEVKQVRLGRLQELWGNRVEQALLAMTPEKFTEAEIRDLGVIAGIGTEKLLLLRGQPTQIIQTQDDRKKIQDLVAEFMIEAKRRGYDVTPDPVTNQVRLEREKDTTMRSVKLGRRDRDEVIEELKPE